MRISDEVLRHLTLTERRVVEYFTRYGGTAKDIAKALGISERTVYKALYKYRRVASQLGLDASEFSFRKRVAAPTASPGKTREPPPMLEISRSHTPRSPPLGNTDCREIVPLLRRILSELERMNANLEKLGRLTYRQPERPKSYTEKPVGETMSEPEEGLPSFASNNPWLRVLSGRSD